MRATDAGPRVGLIAPATAAAGFPAHPSSRHGRRWLWRFIAPQRARLLGLLALSLLGTGLALAQPWLVKLMIDDGLLARDYGHVLAIVGLMVTVGLAATALGGLNRYLHTRLSGRILFALREDLFAHLQTLSPSFFGRRRLGDIVSRLDGDVAQIQRFAVDSLFSAVTNSLSLLGAVVLLVSLEPTLALITLSIVPLELYYLRRMRPRIERRTRSVRERSADVGSFVMEVLPGIKFVQSVAAEGREFRRLKRLDRAYLKELLALQLTEFATSAMPAVMTSLARAAAFLVGGYRVVEGDWQLGALIAFATYLSMVAGPAQSLLGLYVAVQRAKVNFDRVFELYRVKPAVRSPEAPAALAQPVRGEIELRSVVFGYEGGSGPVLEHASARFAAGRKTGLVGASGAGKSTLIDLLMRHFDPQGGQLLFDGVPLERLELATLRRQIAVVSQDLVLFRGSLRDNLLYANPAAGEAQLQDAVERAQLGEFIAGLPAGLETQLGERATQLSGGQKQRIAIARALLQQPRVLVLDEATSAVDSETEQRVVDAIDSLFADRTRIVISHRGSALAKADSVLRLQNGRLRTLTAEEAIDV